MKHILSTILLLLLLSPMAWAAGQRGVLYDLVVAKDGSGDFDNIQDAINAIRDYKPEGRQRILVRKGVYEEKVIVPSYKTNITLIGEDRDSTILIWHDHANMRTETGWPAFRTAAQEQAQRDGLAKQGRKIGTFQSYTLRVDGLGFECENMTISNDALAHWNQGWWQKRSNSQGVGQAVAVHVEADRVVFRNCRLLGFQDTVFTGNDDSRQVYYHCYIEGTVDFIFGPATCWFEECEVHAISNGYLTAASTPGDHPYGYVFHKCRVTADSLATSFYLGRPWRNWASVIFDQCELPASVRAEGWHNWRDPAREKTARYYEYKCTGPGADLSKRVQWMRHLTQAEAADLKPRRVLDDVDSFWPTNFRQSDFTDLHYAFYDEHIGKGTRYKAGTLEPAQLPADLKHSTEPLVMNLKEVDCTTFVEYMCAAMLGRVYQPTDPNDSIMQRFVQALRYRQGVRGNYATRKHYFSEWITDNEAQGLMQDITATLPRAKRQQRTINFMSQNRTLYPQLAASDSLVLCIEQTERALSAQSYWMVPKGSIHKVYGQLHHGDIVAFTCNKKGLDIFHCGFVWWPNPEYDEPRLLHASSVAGQVTISPVPLAEYAQSIDMCSGIRVMRLNLQ
ncbi:MAG: DUF1460 domain-containing protein [Bacteroidales bacterium]|nr:DUF1460 domain-containing protein [Bacteroidales bacterium]